MGCFKLIVIGLILVKVNFKKFLYSIAAKWFLIFSELNNISRMKKELKRNAGIWETQSIFVQWFSKKTSSYSQVTQKKQLNIEKKFTTFQVLRLKKSFWSILRIMWLIKNH